MEETGYIILADISGYTEFVTRTEIEHGAEIVQNLIEIIVGEINTPIRVVGIEGDAVFAHAATDGFNRGELLLEVVEAIYSEFHTALADSHRSTTCECRACSSMGDLDLKFVVHHGSYTEQVIGSHKSIVGPDIILAHRLLKNTIPKDTGFRAYAFFTENAIESLGVEEAIVKMTPHGESYEHLGVVKGYVQDLASYWAKESKNREVIVAAEDSWFVRSETVAVPRSVAWAVYADPKVRQRWVAADSLTATHKRPGRHAVGTVAHCVHGKDVRVLKTLAWKPLHYATIGLQLPFDALALSTISFEDVPGGTKINFCIGSASHPKAFVRALLTLGFMPLKGKYTRRIRAEQDSYLAMLRDQPQDAVL